MHQELDAFEAKEYKLQTDIRNMTRVMKDVKKVEDDLVKKETQLEQKVKEQQDNKGSDWGADSVETHPLLPHLGPFGPRRSFQDKLHELGERIH